MRLRNFFPTKLFNRLLIIVLLPLLMVQLLTVTVFYVRHWNTVTRHMAQNLVSDLSAIVSQVKDKNNPIDYNLLSLSEKLNLELSWITGQKLPTYMFSSNTYAEKAFKLALENNINLPFISDFISDEDYISVGIQLDHGVLGFKFSKKRVFSSTSWIFVSWSIGSSLLLFALTLIFISAQVRPIKRLARTAYNLGIGKDIQNIPISGASEVRLATRAVISMASRIRNQMNDRTEMLAGVSHDLRTPLTRLRLQIAMLPKTSEIVSMTKDLEEMENMISEYLSFAKNNIVEPMSEVDLNKLFHEIIEQFKSSKFRVKLKISPTNLTFSLRPQSFKRAMVNIISNAQRYAKNSEILIRKTEDTLLIFIDDDGPGIGIESREDVLKPFYRLETSRNKNTGGTGLGLSIANNITLSHGGSLELKKSPLKGLRVKISLPV
ncbi:MAG: ATP-binding protein [Candidatus Puniceispirillales bacterium]